MKQSLISCVVPVFNGALYIASALESILSQTYAPFEIIVVNDGSTDATADVLASYREKIRLLSQENAGPAAARNLGLEAAQGEFVAFLDADDLWHPSKLELQINRFQARPELELCITHVQNFWIPELEKEKDRFHNHPFAQPLPGYTTQALLARRALFDRVGRFNSALRVVDDTVWFLRAIEQGVIMELLPDVLVYRRLHQSNITRTSGARGELFEIIKASLDRRRSNPGA